MVVRTKTQNYRLWQGGVYGNKLRAWKSIDEWKRSGFLGDVVIRSAEGKGGYCVYNIKSDELNNRFLQMLYAGIIESSSSVMINEAAPKESAILQGEYFNGIYTGGSGWGYFIYSRAKLHMRDALKESPQISQGLMSDLMLKEAMTEASWENWNRVLTLYPDHVLEVSIYDRCLGDIPNNNTLIWEVRRY